MLAAPQESSYVLLHTLYFTEWKEFKKQKLKQSIAIQVFFFNWKRDKNAKIKLQDFQIICGEVHIGSIPDHITYEKEVVLEVCRFLKIFF